MSIEAELETIVRKVVGELMEATRGKRDSKGNLKRLVSRAPAATYLGVDVKTFDTMRSRGEIRQVLMPSRGTKRQKPMFDLDELDRWIEANKTRGAA